jgi:hypothetical protein
LGWVDSEGRMLEDQDWVGVSELDRGFAILRWSWVDYEGEIAGMAGFWKRCLWIVLQQSI